MVVCWDGLIEVIWFCKVCEMDVDCLNLPSFYPNHDALICSFHNGRPYKHNNHIAVNDSIAPLTE